ncbi:hypothetical protein JCM9492_03890 [Aquifex pyrophilus]
MILLLLIPLIAFSLSVKLEGAITDISVYEEKIAVGTESGKLYILSKNLKVLSEVSFPEFTDFMGEKQKPKVFSVDLYKGKALAVCEDNLGKSTVYLYENNNLKPVLKLTDARKAMFYGDNDIIVGTISNEVWRYNLKEGKTLYRYLVFRFVFSDFDMNEERNLIAWGDESGKVFFINPEDGRLIGVATEGNKDKIFKVSFSRSKVISGGRDKRAVLYDLGKKVINRETWRKKLDAPSLLKNLKTPFINRKIEFILLPEKVFETDFMVFAVALSPEEHYAAYTPDDRGTVKVVRLSDFYEFSLNANCFINALEFISEDKLAVGCIDGSLKILEVKR